MNKITFYTLILLFISFSSYGQSKIKKAEESLKKETNSSKTSKSKFDDSKNNTSENDLLTEVIGGFFIQIFTYTAYGIAIESPFEMENKSSNAFITKYPYLNSNKGNYSYDWDEGSEIFKTTISNRYIFENSRINGNHLNLNMRFFKRVGLEIDYLQLWENNPNFGKDNLAIYKAMVKYYRVRTERFDLWWGLGASYIDGEVNELGFTYGLGAELFFAKPLSLEVNFNQTLVNSETVNQFNGLLNYHLKQYKFSGGYAHLKIGSQKFSTMSLGLGVSF